MHCDAHSVWRLSAQAFIHILGDLLEPICDYMVVLLGGFCARIFDICVAQCSFQIEHNVKND